MAFLDKLVPLPHACLQNDSILKAKPEIISKHQSKNNWFICIPDFQSQQRVLKLLGDTIK